MAGEPTVQVLAWVKGTGLSDGSEEDGERLLSAGLNARLIEWDLLKLLYSSYINPHAFNKLLVNNAVLRLVAEYLQSRISKLLIVLNSEYLLLIDGHIAANIRLPI